MHCCLRLVRRSPSPIPVRCFGSLASSPCCSSSIIETINEDFEERRQFSRRQWPDGVEVSECRHVGIYCALGKSHAWLTKKVAGQLLDKVRNKLEEMEILASINHFTVYGDEKRVRLSIRNKLSIRIDFQSVPNANELDMYRSSDVIKFADLVKPVACVVLICDGGSKLVHAVRIMKHLGYQTLLFIPKGECVSWQLCEVVDHCTTFDLTSRRAPSSTSPGDIPSDAYPFPALRTPPYQVMPDNMRSYPMWDPRYYTLERRNFVLAQKKKRRKCFRNPAGLLYEPKVMKFGLYCSLKAVDGWLVKDNAGQVYGKLMNKLFELGLRPRELMFMVYGDTTKIGASARRRLYRCGISLEWIPDKEAEVEKALAEGMMQFIEEYRRGTYIVLMCDRGSGLVSTVENLKNLGYRVILVIRKEDDTCPTLRLVVEHCILMD